MDFQIVLPGKTIAGKGALSRAGLEKYGKKPLIVTGKHTAKSQAAAELLKYAPGGVVFDGITGEPTVEMINAGVAAYHENSCDHVIGIGGGSALDSAKAIAAMSALGGNIADYMGKEIDGEFPPMVLIPTTAGTGSEATKFTIITDTEKDIKMLLKGDKLRGSERLRGARRRSPARSVPCRETIAAIGLTARFGGCFPERA